MLFCLLHFPLEKVLLLLIGYQKCSFMCPILSNHIKTQSLFIWKIQVHQICYYTWYSVGLNLQLMKKNGIYLWFCTVQEWCINIVLLLGFSQSNTMKKEIIFTMKYSSIYHISLKTMCMLIVFGMVSLCIRIK